MGKNILILSAGRRVSLVNAFKKEAEKRKCGIKVFTADMAPDTAPACILSEATFRLPAAEDKTYRHELLQLCVEKDIGLVVPTIDPELSPLAAIKTPFFDLGINVIISESSFIRDCRDKRRTPTLFHQMGIDSPQIFGNTDAKFPCFAKPYDGSASHNTRIIRSQEELYSEKRKDEKLIFMEYISDDSFVEYSVDVYCDRNNEIKCVVPRKRLQVRGGEVSKSITEHNAIYSRILNNKYLDGAVGCLTIQVFWNEKDNQILGIEVNPRFGGGFPLTYKSGANYPGWLIDEYLFDKKINFYENWKRDLLMLRYDKEVFVDESPS